MLFSAEFAAKHSKTSEMVKPVKYETINSRNKRQCKGRTFNTLETE